MKAVLPQSFFLLVVFLCELGTLYATGGRPIKMKNQVLNFINILKNPVEEDLAILFPESRYPVLYSLPESNFVAGLLYRFLPELQNLTRVAITLLHQLPLFTQVKPQLRCISVFPRILSPCMREDYLRWIVESLPLFKDPVNWHQILLEYETIPNYKARLPRIFSSVEQSDLVGQFCAYSRTSQKFRQSFPIVLPVLQAGLSFDCKEASGDADTDTDDDDEEEGGGEGEVEEGEEEEEEEGEPPSTEDDDQLLITAIEDGVDSYSLVNGENSKVLEIQLLPHLVDDNSKTFNDDIEKSYEGGVTVEMNSNSDRRDINYNEASPSPNCSKVLDEESLYYSVPAEQPDQSPTSQNDKQGGFFNNQEEQGGHTEEESQDREEVDLPAAVKRYRWKKRSLPELALDGSYASWSELQNSSDS